MLQIFHRPELAHQLALRVVDPPATSATRSGLFLSAPRRTGKSTFLREDLIPALENAGALVLYVDLWQQRDADPGDTIIAAVGSALKREAGALKRLLDSTGIQRISGLSVGSLSISLDEADAGKGVNVSTTQALAALSDETRRVIVLIIDEAQHAITTSAGANALFGLKAARDELNGSRHHGLRIIATGSSSDKLAMLRNSKQQAFFGAPLVPFPALGKDYVRWFIEQQENVEDLDVDEVARWFDRAGHRPELLGAAMDAVTYEIGADQGTIVARLEQAIDREIAASYRETLDAVRALSPLQSSVLREMAARGTGYAPFETSTLKRYAATLDEIDPDGGVTPTATNVQRALSTLQKHGLVWRASRGSYALEEPQLADLLRREGMID